MKDSHNFFYIKLELEGFGLYREKTVFDFSPGINVMRAGNEQGKSTMASGLVAVFFGLSQRKGTTNPFSLERFRNWDNPKSCGGSLYFHAKDALYLVRRNFDSHRTELWLMKDLESPNELIVEGEHNPEARKSLELYEDKLMDLLGMNSREIFSDTYFLAQPLPEKENISSELQGLLSGGRGTAFHKALERLVDDLRKLTKFTGPRDRGVTARNNSRDGKLELLNAGIEDLQREINQKRSSADSLADIRLELAKTEKELDSVRNGLRLKEKNMQALSEWNVMATKYHNAARERIKLVSAEKEAMTLKNDIDETARKQQIDYPEFNERTEDTGKRLAELISLEKKLAGSKELISKLENDIKRNRIQCAEKEKKLKDEPLHVVLKNNPKDKLKVIKNNIESCINEWRSFTDMKRELEELEKELIEDYSLFTGSEPDDLALLTEYGRNNNFFRKELEDAIRELTEKEEKEASYQKSVQHLEAQYGDLMGLPDEIPEIIDRKLAALKKKREIESDLPVSLPKAGSYVFFGLIIALLLSVIGVVTLRLIFGVGVYLVFVALVFAFFGFKISQLIVQNYFQEKQPDFIKHPKTEKKLVEIAEELSLCDRSLQSLATAGEAELGKIYQRFSYYHEEKKRLISVRENLSEVSSTDLEELRQKIGYLTERIKRYDDILKPFIESYEDVMTAHSRWLNLKDNRDKLRNKLESFTLERFNLLHVDDVFFINHSETRIDGKWRESSLFLEILTGAEEQLNIGLLAEKMASLDDEDWQMIEEKAGYIAETIRESESLRYGNEVLSKRLEEEREALLKVQEAITLCAAGIETIIAGNYNDIFRTVKRLEELEMLEERKKSQKIKLETILSAYDAADIQSIQEKAAFAQDNATVMMRRWQDHIADNIGLPGTEDYDAPERSFRENLQKEVDSLNERKDYLENRRNELYRRQSSLEGERPLNIAAAEIELNELLGEKEKTEISADALEMAFFVLNDAINDYRLNYRERLELKSTEYIEKISAMPDRKLLLDDAFNIVVSESGRRCSLAQLSKGARDQLYLSLRFALADFLSEERKLPMIFDDPFTSTDFRRLANIRTLLQAHQGGRQFIILTHNDTFYGWGKEIVVYS